ncbi:MAG: diguanylate cyclase [Nitrospinae bacterium]|nr:diguanylate cyclase [Nitrospinota bacterium]
MEETAYPNIGSIATIDVVVIDNKKSITAAIGFMVKRNVRDIVVYDSHDNSYAILIANDLIRSKIHGIDFESPLSSLDLPPLAKLDYTMSILELMENIEDIKEYTSVVENGKLVGIISYSDIIANLEPKLLVRNKKLADIVTYYRGKTAEMNEPTIDVISRMAYSSDNAIVVLEGPYPTGSFTTKDFLKLAYNRADFGQPIKNYMTSPVTSMNVDKTVGDAVDYMQKSDSKRVIVTDKDSKFVGIVTQKDLLRMGYNKWIDYMQGQNTLLSKVNKNLKDENYKLEGVANYDFLTRLYNRSKFADFIGHEIKTIKRYGGKLFSVFLLDIDFFKKINDTYGHLAGDMVLKELADLLKLSLRESDIISRWGGEEFITLLPSTSIDNASMIAEKIRKNIEAHTFSRDDIKATCSFGVAEYRAGETEEALFKRVDEALYRAKEGGRNRVELSA